MRKKEPKCSLGMESRSAKHIDPVLIHEEFVMSDEVRTPPRGPVVVSLQDLIQATEMRKEKPRRKIQVTGRRMERFVPPMRKRDVVESPEILMDDGQMIKEENKHKRSMGFRKNRAVGGEGCSNWKQRSHSPVRRAADIWGPDAEEREEIVEFFGQLWHIPDTTPPPDKRGKQTLVWIRKDLFEKRSFGAGDCYPVQPNDRVGEPKSISISREKWFEGRKPTYQQIERKVLMADWGRGGGSRGGGGGGAGRWRPPNFYGQYPPPFNPFFFPDYYDPYQFQEQQQFYPRGSGPRGNRPGYQRSQQNQQTSRQIGQNQAQPRQGVKHGEIVGSSSDLPEIDKGKATVRKEEKKGETITSAKPMVTSGGGKTGAGSNAGKSVQFVKVICYNCGVPGHHKASCPKPKICFICKKEDHVVEGCPVRQEGQLVAKYIGNAASGLGFYQVEIPADEEQINVDFTNCGKVYIESGEITKEELVREFAACFNPHWPWQIRQLEEWTFLVRFPPNKKVEDMADFNSFNLNKEGVSVRVEPWNGELEPYAYLEDVWIQIRGLPPKWCQWRVINQIVASYGLIEDVDWQGLFQSFYEVVRVRLKCRDATKIPKERLFCLNKQLYMLQITVEKAPDISDLQGTNKGDDDNDDDEADDLDDPPEDKVDGKMDTDEGGAGSPSNGGAGAGGPSASVSVACKDKRPSGSGTRQTSVSKDYTMRSIEEIGYLMRDKEITHMSEQLRGEHNGVMMISNDNADKDDMSGFTVNSQSEDSFEIIQSKTMQEYEEGVIWQQRQEERMEPTQVYQLLREMELIPDEGDDYYTDNFTDMGEEKVQQVSEQESEQILLDDILPTFASVEIQGDTRSETKTTQGKQKQEANSMEDDKDSKILRRCNRGHKWGPVIAERRSERCKNDGKTIHEKAAELTARRNLEGIYAKSKDDNREHAGNLKCVMTSFEMMSELDEHQGGGKTRYELNQIVAAAVQGGDLGEADEVEFLFGDHSPSTAATNKRLKISEYDGVTVVSEIK